MVTPQRPTPPKSKSEQDKIWAIIWEHQSLRGDMQYLPALGDLYNRSIPASGVLVIVLEHNEAFCML